MQGGQDVYLVQGYHFWHCELVSFSPIRLQIRTGRFSMPYREDADTVEVQFTLFQTMKQGVDFMSDLIQSKLSSGYEEISSAEVVKIYDQEDQQKELQQFQQTKKRRKKKDEDDTMNLPDKPITELTDDATNGKLIGNQPKNKSREQLGASLTLGNGGDQPIKCLLADTWTEKVNPAGMYLSEKLDGMRMVWTGSEMFTRNGNSINFPAYFIEGWPNAYLDGELWLDRNSFQKLISITKKQTPDFNNWKNIKFMVFDAPMLTEPFKQRYAKIKKVCEKIKNPHLVYVPHIICNGKDHLKKELLRVQEIGGEGLMLRDPASGYEFKRSKTLLKVKSVYDSEARVTGYEEGMGKCEGMIGALKCITDEGVEFSVGSGFTQAQRLDPPGVGSRITYKYYGLTEDGVPRFPIFARIREKE